LTQPGRSAGLFPAWTAPRAFKKRPACGLLNRRPAQKHGPVRRLSTQPGPRVEA